MEEKQVWIDEYNHCFKALKNHISTLENAKELLEKQVEIVYIQREAKHMDRLLRRIKAIKLLKES